MVSAHADAIHSFKCVYDIVVILVSCSAFLHTYPYPIPCLKYPHNITTFMEALSSDSLSKSKLRVTRLLPQVQLLEEQSRVARLATVHKSAESWL